MSSGDLQEMEVGTKQSKTAVNSGAKPADPMPTMADPGTQLGSVEDLGGPTPENYKPDDDSAKLKEPGATLKQVKDVVNKGAKPADSMPKMANPVKEEEEIEDEEKPKNEFGLDESEDSDVDFGGYMPTALVKSKTEKSPPKTKKTVRVRKTRKKVSPLK